MNVIGVSSNPVSGRAVSDLPEIEAAVRRLRTARLLLTIAECDRVEAGRVVAEADDALNTARRAYREAQDALFEVAEQQDGNPER